MIIALFRIRQMFSDLHSVRSLPNSPGRTHFRTTLAPCDMESPSQASRLRSPRHHENWRTAIHPEIDAKYNMIVNGETPRWEQAQAKGKMLEPVDPNAVSKQDRSLGSPKKVVYEQQIHGLETQNNNLREELYYLREALLINFQSKHAKNA